MMSLIKLYFTGYTLFSGADHIMWEGNQRELWKLEFPECAERAVQQIKAHFVHEANKDNIPGLGDPEEASAQIVDDFIFVHSSQRKIKHSRVITVYSHKKVNQLLHFLQCLQLTVINNPRITDQYTL